MDESFGCGLRESYGSVFQLCFGSRFVTGGHGLVDLSNQAADGGLYRAGAGAALERLSMTLRCRTVICQRGSSEMNSDGS